MNWYVVYTKPKWEKRVSDQLLKFGVNCFCPLVNKVQQYSDRKKKVVVPLFNNYVFVQLAEKDRNLVFGSPGVIRYLFWLGKHAIVKDNEINTIKDWIAKGDKLDISVSQHKVGDTIKLNSSPFLDQNAIIKEITNKHYILVLESLGCILKIEHLA
ncbi:transcription termination/antitermination protein NusG [Flavobacterium franklandianum]|uniref:UpxY family transcription antiterminator n=1 Tax=Flavobacterium franklandianum TaxID=2594430 RepID=A0A553C680_9FLAO|nr:UpxY family transcription antiterminator [Flavobacterium franklandianum]TRX15966.1 UpxY family transcription antiterminator [Flavobacterium franklandianum]